MKQPAIFDFRAIMAKPLNVTGIPQIRTLSPEHIQNLVRNNHPSSRRNTQRKPAFVK